MAKINKSEQQWQAQDDAMTMARYQEIMSDKARLQRAVKVAKQKAEDLNKRVTALNAVAKQGTSGRKSSKKK
jgi:hypothetical protein